METSTPTGQWSEPITSGRIKAFSTRLSAAGEAGVPALRRTRPLIQLVLESADFLQADHVGVAGSQEVVKAFPDAGAQARRRAGR